jgi:hypothetical protein
MSECRQTDQSQDDKREYPGNAHPAARRGIGLLQGIQYQLLKAEHRFLPDGR